MKLAKHVAKAKPCEIVTETIPYLELGDIDEGATMLHKRFIYRFIPATQHPEVFAKGSWRISCPVSTFHGDQQGDFLQKKLAKNEIANDTNGITRRRMQFGHSRVISVIVRGRNQVWRTKFTMKLNMPRIPNRNTKNC